MFLPRFEWKTVSRLDHIEISSYEIENIISTLNINKAVGPDLISHKVLKNIKSSVARPLCKLFNNDQTFPLKWKESIVNPLFKKGDKSLASNYRPISLLSCIGKLMYNYLFCNRLLYNKQSGFLKGHSTVHQLLEIYHQVVSSLDSRQNLSSVKMRHPAHYAMSSRCARSLRCFWGVKGYKMNHKKIFFLKITKKKIS